MISLKALEEMFANMRMTPSTNAAGDLLWGYFFFDSTQEPLLAASEELERKGYTIVRNELTDDGSSYVLHVERVETHTPQSLYQRNADLEALAQAHGIDSYDGMDVGPVPGRQ
jgi:Regulator of ribonuclease activity B